jgi:hypothetical protein
MVARKDIVTDEAVVRYLERVYGIDVSRLKRRIAKATEGGRALGADAVLSEGVRYKLSKDGRVLSVMGLGGSPMSNRGRRWKARRK